MGDRARGWVACHFSGGGATIRTLMSFQEDRDFIRCRIVAPPSLKEWARRPPGPTTNEKRLATGNVARRQIDLRQARSDQPRAFR